jgi:hypothetical protein
MRSAAELDRMLENAVAAALGLDKPHPKAAPRKVHAARVKPSRRSHRASPRPRHHRMPIAA